MNNRPVAQGNLQMPVNLDSTWKGRAVCLWW